MLTSQGDPVGGGTTYTVIGGATYGNEHKFADRFVIPEEAARSSRLANPRDVTREAGETARWRMTGESGRPTQPTAASNPSVGGSSTVAAPATGTSLMNVAGTTAGSITKATVPGVVEAETALVGSAYVASGYTATAPLVTPLLTAAEAVPVVGGSLVAGGVVGNLAEGGARALGASERVAEESGALAAGLTGAAVGALIGSPTGIGAPVGAAIGFAAGVAGYYLSRSLR